MNARQLAPRVAPESHWEMPVGLVLSVLLHLLIALLAIFGLPFIADEPPQVEESVPVDLVPLGDITAAPAPKPAELKPPEPPKEAAKPEPPKETQPPPAPTPPPPPAPSPPTPAPPPPPPPPPQPKAEVPPPVPKPEPPKETPKPPDQLAEVKPPPKKPPPQENDFDSLLKTITKMKDQSPPQDQPQKPAKPQPPKQDDFKSLEKEMAQMQSQPAPPVTSQSSNSTVAAPNLSEQASATDKDYVAGQFRRCWNFDPGARDPASLVVQIHVTLRPDGSVINSEIVSNPRYDSDSYFRSAADSARRATLACQPIKLPPGKYDVLKDLVLNFDPRDSLR